MFSQIERKILDRLAQKPERDRYTEIQTDVVRGQDLERYGVSGSGGVGQEKRSAAQRAVSDTWRAQYWTEDACADTARPLRFWPVLSRRLVRIFACGIKKTSGHSSCLEMTQGGSFWNKQKRKMA